MIYDYCSWVVCLSLQIRRKVTREPAAVIFVMTHVQVLRTGVTRESKILLMRVQKLVKGGTIHGAIIRLLGSLGLILYKPQLVRGNSN
jgi:hypothetical protein